MDTPMLYQLMGAYFHQDWAFDGDEAAVVGSFLREEPGAAAVAEEIDRVLASSSEQEVAELVRALGSFYTPSERDGGYRGWLDSIAARARAR